MPIRVWSNQVDRARDFTQARVRDMGLLKGLKVGAGVPLAGLWPDMVLDVYSAYPPADTFLSGPMLLASERLVQVLRRFSSPADFEALPVSVAFSGEPTGCYFVVNILKRLDALDRPASTFTEASGWVDSIDTLAIDESSVGSCHFFRLLAFEWVVCVSVELARAVEEAGITGVVFRTPEEWRPC